MMILPVSSKTLRNVLLTVTLIGIAALMGKMAIDLSTVKKERDAFAVTVGVQKQSLDDMTRANHGLQDTINDLVDKFKADEETRKRIEKEIAQVNDAIRSQRRELRTLGEKNATVREYLDTPVPSELRGLYNRADAAATASGSNKNLVSPTTADASRPAARTKGETDSQERRPVR